MIFVTQSNTEDLYEIRSPYDPSLIELIKQVPGRRWVPERKVWTVPLDRLGFFINQVKGTVYESQLSIQSDEDIDVNSSIGTTDVIPDIDISHVPYYVKKGCKPYQHQLDFMKFSLDRQQRGNMNGFLCADDPGLAKTNESINLALYNRKQYGFKHCLIICCVNSSKLNWRSDTAEHTDKKEIPYILGTRLKRNGLERTETGSKEKYEDLVSGHMYGSLKADKLPYFLIMNIEAIRYKVGKTYPIRDELVKMTLSGDLNMIIIDEIHRNSSPSSLQGKQLLELKKKTGKKLEWLPMTGTPITNKPTDVFLPLRLVEGHDFSSYYMWCQKFCIYGGFGGHEIVGYKNIPYLKNLLQGNMIRRLKSDVLDLPPKIYYTEYVENTAYQEKLYAKVVGDIESREDEFRGSLNPLAMFLRLRQVNGSPELVDPELAVDSDYLRKNAKLEKLLDLLEDIHERHEKVIIFSNWVEPLRTLYRFVSKRYKTCCFTGTMTVQDREKHKSVFMNNPEYTVMIGTVGAMGTAQTLTAARNVIFYDEPWTPADKVQAEERIYRIGTTESVNIYTILTKDTVDERVHNILYTKDSISKFIVDNKLDIKKDPNLFKFLLNGEK